MAPRVLVTGVSGQDGSYLAERLVDEGAEVHGMVRPADPTTPLFADGHPEVMLHTADLADSVSLAHLIDEVEPDEIYHLAGISSVAYSWAYPAQTAVMTGVAAAVVLGAALQLQERTGQRVAVVQATSAEIFGQPATAPQDESTPVRPISPYGAAKAYAHHMVGVLRGRGLAASSLILFNHESPRRPTSFVTRKITSGAARIARDRDVVLTLGNLDARRDWGWAPDYVDAMVRAARTGDRGDDYVIATGATHTVADFAEVALRHVGLGDAWRDRIEVDPALLRPVDATEQRGDASKARDLLGWRPSVSFVELVEAMVDADLA